MELVRAAFSLPAGVRGEQTGRAMAIWRFVVVASLGRDFSLVNKLVCPMLSLWIMSRLASVARRNDRREEQYEEHGLPTLVQEGRT
jgi:hypothetical protein